MNSTPRQLQADCAIAGGGPAGMMLGWLLSRAGVSVIVMEKHADFLRDFRGDTVHPSTLEVMWELGVLDRFLQRPHQKIHQLNAQIGDMNFTVADYSRLPVHCKFMVMMPQWEFLDFVAAEARSHTAFKLLMRTEVTGLIEEEGHVTGARAESPDGPLEVRAQLVVGADGRASRVREASGLTVDEIGAPMDILWMRFSKRPDDPAVFFRNGGGRVLVKLDRGDYWQTGMSIVKGSFEDWKGADIGVLHRALIELDPILTDRVEEIRSWKDVRLLTVRVNRLRQWYRDGLLCIGDAAHAMSPVGGVGINLAIQDAVAAANRIWKPLLSKTLTNRHLRDIQQRRVLPTRITQNIQRNLQRVSVRTQMPLLLRLLERTGFPKHLRARMVGLGLRREHVKTPAVNGMAIPSV